jgi:hypothetical protein
MVEMRVLNSGEILDHAIWLAKDRWRFCVLACLPYLFIAVASQLAIKWAYPEFYGMGGADNLDPTVFFGGMALAAVFGLANWFIVFPIVTSLLIYGLSMSYVGRPVTIGQAAGYVLRRLLRVMFASWIGTICIFIGFACFYVGGITLSVFWWVIMPIIVLEATPLSESFARAPRLMNGHKLRALALVFVLLFMGWGGFPSMFYPGHIVSIFLGTVVYTVQLAIACGVVLVTYFSARCRLEHLDLDMLVEAVDPSDTEATIL